MNSSISFHPAQNHVGDVGTEIRAQIRQGCRPQNLTALKSAAIKIQRPDGSLAVLPATVLGAPADGLLTTEVTEGTFTADGEYIFQPAIDLGAWRGHASVQLVPVRCSLPC